MRTIDGRGWEEFEATKDDGATVLAGDLSTASDAREELEELEEFVEELEGSAERRDAVRAHLRAADAVVGIQVFPSVYDDSVAAANVIIAYLEQWPGVLTQVDTVGWYDGSEQILSETD